MRAALKDVPQPSVEQRRPACRAGPSAYVSPDIWHSVRGGSAFAEPPLFAFSSRLFAAFAVDNDAFLKFYINLLTLSVPVDF